MWAWLFSAPPPPPEELIKDWRIRMRKECHMIDREIRKIDVAENKLKIDARNLAKIGQPDAARILCEEVVALRAQRMRCHRTKQRMNEVSMMLAEQLASIKLTKAISLCTQSMRMMNKLVSAPAIGKVMRELSQEMEKAGFIQSMIDEKLDSNADSDDEIKVDDEMEQVMDEITAGIVLPNVPVKPAATAAGFATKLKQPDSL